MPEVLPILGRTRRGIGDALSRLPHSLQPRRLRDRTSWAIGIYGGAGPLEMGPLPGQRNPVITRRDIHDVDAGFVADPFLLEWDGRWYLFFEIFDWATGLGVIGVASSSDARTWRYDGVAVREPHHVSYPFPIIIDGVPHLVVESWAAGTTQAYRSVDFPRRWEAVAEVLGGARVDSTPFEHEGRWYLFSGRYDAGWRVLDLHMAAHPLGPYAAHPASPVVSDDRRIARPAGPVVRVDGRLLRFGQDNRRDYGERVWAAEIVDISQTSYRERVLLDRPVVAGTGRGWNRAHMHHVDAHQLRDGSWIAAVDGW